MTRRALSTLLPMLACAIVFLMVSATSVHHRVSAAELGTASNRNLQTVNANGARINCKSLPGVKNGVILGYIVPCVAKTMEISTQRFSKKMIIWLRPLLMSFLTFVITMFGIKLLQGGGQLHVEGFILILKIGFVLLILEMIPDQFVPALYGVMNETQAIVASTVGPDRSSIKCNINTYGDASTPLVWAHMDCLIGKLYGITTGRGPGGEKTPNMLLASSIFGLLGGFFFGGTFGIILFCACIGMLWSMFSIVLRTAVTYLNGYLFACLMMIIAPLILPLILLNVTRTYFDPWWKAIIASILMPLIVTAYAMFALLLYDKMMFADDALVKKLFDNTLVKKMQGQPEQLCDVQQTGNPEFIEKTTGETLKDALAKNPILANFVNPMATFANNQCAGLNHPTLKLSGTDPQFSTDKKAYELLFQDCIKLFILSFLISSGFKTIIKAMTRITGSNMVSSVMAIQSKQETLFAQGLATSKDRAMRAMRDNGEQGEKFKDYGAGGAKGADFVARIPAMGQGAVTGFIQPFVRK